jgi:hypothetical protein
MEVRNVDEPNVDDEPDITVTIMSIHEEHEQFRISVNPNTSANNIYHSIIDYMELQNTKYLIDSVTMGQEYVIEKSLTCEENGIEDNARLEVNLRERFSFDRVVRDMIQINPGIDEMRLRRGFHKNGDLSWQSLGINQLPESFGDLEINGHLYLNNNRLTSLPESFDQLTIGKDLWLSYNKLTSLSESFGNLKIGGNLYLGSNKLTTLPESFSNLTVNGDLSLNINKLTSLPDNFGNLQVGSNLYLGGNKLVSLPNSFSNLTVDGGLYLGNDIKIYREWVDNTKLTLPNEVRK